jgi:uncharacterized membrane protein YjjP (DUF1212 family)
VSEQRSTEATSIGGVVPPGGADTRTLLEFLSQLGIAMSVAGQPVSDCSTSLLRIAAAYGHEVQVTVLPATTIVKLGGRELSTLNLASGEGRSLRLDQVAEVFDLVRIAERAMIPPSEGLWRLEGIMRKPSRYGSGVRTLGHAVLAMGLGLILEGSFSALVACFILGLLIGGVNVLSQGHRTAEVLSPVVSSLVVGVVVFLIVKADLVSGPMLLLIPPIVTFLPGASLTTAMIELTSGDTISGSSRLIAGATTLLLLGFGYVIAAELIGLPAAEAFAQEPRPLFGWWAPWLGVLIYGVGIYFHGTAPIRSLTWLWLVLYVAWIGQQLGGQFLSGYLSGFIGAVAMTVVAYSIQRRPGTPPALVTFLPGFWLLVPGSLGLIGLTQLVAANGQAGLQSFGDMTFTIVAIALGVLVGVGVERSLGTLFGQAPSMSADGMGPADDDRAAPDSAAGAQ